MLGRLGSVTLAALALASCNKESSAIRITGSSTVYPFTKAVAEAFAKADGDRAEPAVESTGTAPGIASFCAKGGDAHDIVDASRRMKRAEFDKCQANGVREIVEVPIGLDGVALAESSQGPKLQLSRKDIYLALAANPMGKPNAAKMWKDVNPALPAVPIQVLGPPSTSGTRDAFVELMLEPGCIEAMPEAKAMQAKGDPAAYDRICRRIRTDGAYVEEGEDDSVIVRGLARNPKALGLLGYSYLEENADRLRGVPIDGIAPDYAAISGGHYPGGRTLYLYVNGRSLKQKAALRDFLALYAAMWGPNGPLASHGLVPRSDRTRASAKQAIDRVEPLDTTSLL